jgi:hypothetical protein
LAKRPIELALAHDAHAGEDFGKLARENSEDPGSKDNGMPYPVTADAQLAMIPSSLTFSPADWDTPQTVVVQALASAAVGDSTSTIHHRAGSARVGGGDERGHLDALRRELWPELGFTPAHVAETAL